MDDTQTTFFLGTEETPNTLSIADARAKRLRTLRMMAGITLEGLCRNQSTSALSGVRITPELLQAWEKSWYGGLPEDGAKRLVVLFGKVGVECTAEWLLFGVGIAPQGTNFIYLPTGELTPLQSITQELLLFKRLNPNSTEMVVTDDGMAPHYGKGDFIAGLRYTGAAILEHAINHPCIVETTDGKVLFRQVQPDPNQPECYRLDCSNPNTTATDSVLCGQELKFAAPVVWQRKSI